MLCARQTEHRIPFQKKTQISNIKYKTQTTKRFWLYFHFVKCNWFTTKRSGITISSHWNNRHLNVVATSTFTFDFSNMLYSWCGCVFHSPFSQLDTISGCWFSQVRLSVQHLCADCVQTNANLYFIRSKGKFQWLNYWKDHMQWITTFLKAKILPKTLSLCEEITMIQNDIFRSYHLTAQLWYLDSVCCLCVRRIVLHVNIEHHSDWKMSLNIKYTVSQQIHFT